MAVFLDFLRTVLCRGLFFFRLRSVRHLGNCNLTVESPQIFTRRPQSPDKGIGTLCGKCYTHKVFDGFDFKGKVEGSQKLLVITLVTLSNNLNNLKR